ncbi:unnamed protein product [Rotaria sp. Silwood2]|nr:unnamed protein product [Rotaria sp. Silwood2]CAF4670849.1 unnamed protein product [Rotaria sp. Silwood2]
MTSNMTRGLSRSASMSLALNNSTDSIIEQWRRIIESTPQKTNVPTSVIGGVMYQESRGRANVNTTQNQQREHDTGLMLVNNGTLAEMR